VNSVLRLWRTTTVRLTALFILIFVLFSIGLLAFIAFQSSIVIQRQQNADIDREISQIERTSSEQGIRAVVIAVQRLANRPGPGIYYLGDELGRMVAGNVSTLPQQVMETAGTYTFDYERQRAFDRRPNDPVQGNQDTGYALVRSTVLDNGLHLVVGRDIVERRGFAAIIFEGFAWGVLGIVVFSVIAGGLTARRVLRRIDSITGTSTKIMSGNLAERVPVTGRDDEFDRLATSLNQMLDRIEQLMQGLKEVTDNVAHDLKTPLTRLRNRAEAALQKKPGEAGYRTALETTIEESDQLIRTFNALLMIARVEAGTPSGAFDEIDLGAILTDLGELYAPFAEDAGFELQVQAEEAVHLKANRELIGQAVVNLLENAIKYGRGGVEGAGRVTLAARKSSGRIEIEVSDTGPGIPEADRKRVVDRFFRLEKSRTEPGSGLGLSLVSAVAHLHRGELRLEDAGPGLRAIIDLPA
jgi:signal transduction histidine kinase